jgi:maleylpyruvate isomerase
MTATAGRPTPAQLLPSIERTTARFTAAVDGLSDAQFDSPTRLPDWNRHHLIAHVTNLADALARQAEYAGRGERIEVYDDGITGRAAGIERGSRDSGHTQRAELHRAVTRLAAAWPTTAAGWTAPVTYADGTVTDVLLCWWREIAIHLVDLDVGERFAGFDQSLHTELWDFLSERLPPDVSVELVGAGASSSSSSAPLHAIVKNGVPVADRRTDAGSPMSEPADLSAITISGTVAEISAWLAGRDSEPVPNASVAGASAPLPSLLPWPSRAAKPAV